MGSDLIFRKGFNLILLIIMLVSAFPLATSAGVHASSPQTSYTTFYLHDDQHGFGDYSKRFDWANTSTPYNPPNPYFISSSYQGISINASPPYNSFRWIAAPAMGFPAVLSGEVNVTLYLTPSNTSTGSPVDIEATLQNVTGGVISNITSGSTGNIFIVPNELVHVRMNIPGQGYSIGAGSNIVLNLTRIDSNYQTSVYVEFDYSNVPSNFKLNITPRLDSLSASVTDKGAVYDNQSIGLYANVSDSLGSSDIHGVTVTIMNSSGAEILSSAMSNLTTGSYFRSYTYTAAPLEYGNYTVSFVASTVSNMTGYSERYFENITLEVFPSLKYFSVPLSSHLNAGVPYNLKVSAVSDSGQVMQTFDGNVSVTLLYNNGTSLSTSLYSPVSAVFTAGEASFNLTVLRSSNFTLVLSYGRIVSEGSLSVSPSTVQKIVVVPGVYSMIAGENETFSAYGYDIYGNLNTGWTPVWSVTGNIGNITSTGNFLAQRNGSGRIEATDPSDGISGYAEVSVSSGPLFTLDISPSNETLLAGQTYFFQASGYDVYGNPVNVENAVWSTNAGELSYNGSYAVLVASKEPVSSGYIEVTSAGISTSTSVQVIPSAFSPVFLSDLPEITIPSGASLSFNLSPYVSDANDPNLSNVQFHIYGGDSLFYTVGSGVFGEMNITFISFAGVYGSSNVTVVISNSQGYSSSASLLVDILAKPSWNSILPSYMSVEAGRVFSLNYTYFLNSAPYSPLDVRISTSSPYVYTSGYSLDYYFPSGSLYSSFPVYITAADPDNMTAGFIQIVKVLPYPVPVVDTKNAPPSFVSVDRGGTLLLPHTVSSYFYDPTPLSFSVSSSVVSAHITSSGAVMISAPANPISSSGSVLIEANSSHGEFSFLLVEVGIVNDVSPPSVSPIPQIRVHYAVNGTGTYMLSLIPYVTDSYVPIDQVTVLTGTDSIVFSRVNFSLIFSMPANSSGGSVYRGPYWYNTSLLFVGGPLSLSANDSVSVPVSILVSSSYPPSVVPGVRPPAIISVPENGVFRDLNLSALFISPQNSILHFSAVAGKLNVSISTGGTVTIRPTEYFTGSTRVVFLINSSSGFIYYVLLVFVFPIYIPPVVSIPSVINSTSPMFLINLSPYISNPNNLPLGINASGRGVSTAGYYVLVHLPSGISGENIVIFVSSPRGQVIEETVHVRLVSHQSNIYAILSYALLSVVAVFAAIAAYTRLAIPDFELDTLLLIHRDGRLIASGRRKGADKKDSDLIVGMFTAIQDFVSTAFSQMEEDQSLRRIDMGRMSIGIERGRNVFALLLYSGQPPKRWSRDIRYFIETVERRYPALERWDGGQSEIEGIDEMIARLFGR